MREDLFNYNSPFFVSDCFKNYNSKIEWFLKLKLLTCLCTKNTQKISYIKVIKNNFINLIQTVKNDGFIQQNIEIIEKNGSLHKMDLSRLNTSMLTKRVHAVILFEEINK